ncbi:autotransporter assembly complex protein TamA [Marinicella rhabdoformis]|uniref:autotransporter assembly complex protein TamA n=1 Tax=Marinicella rhabdoformis TaxID=2580566 RepID=UPI0012AEBC03|nr:outer membrane protein assembly factor [Marinicella rhabdoformis]
MKSALTLGTVLLWSLLFPALCWGWEITGVPKEIQSNMDNVLIAEPEDCAVNIEKSSLFSDSLLERLHQAIKPYGYFGAEINVLNAENATTCKDLLIAVELNQATHINELSIELVGPGKDDVLLKEIVSNAPLKQGKKLKTFKYEQFKAQLLSQSHALGYLDGHFKSNHIQIDSDHHKANIKLVFVTGPLYHFSSLQFEQTEFFMDETFLNRMLQIKTGDRVLNESIAKQVSLLNDSLYFSQVTAKKVNKSTEQATVDLMIAVSPAKRIKYSVGLGFATDTGARTTLEYQNDRVGSKAYQFKSQAKIAETNQDLSMRFKIPSRGRPLKKWYAIDAGYLFEDIEDKEQSTQKLSVSQSRIYTEQWQNTNFIDVTYGKFGFKGEEKESALLVVPGVSWTWRQADDWVNARNGLSVQMTLQGASDSVLSDVSFVQADIKSKWIHPLGDNNRMIYRGQVGATSIDDLSQLPFSYRFYAGGDRSIRGFDYESLSPMGVENDLIGGKHVVALSAEFEHKWNASWGWAVFTDAGNAFTDELNWEQSVGFGVRWFSPLGPVRLDLAHPLNNEAASNVKVHFTIGPDF